MKTENLLQAILMFHKHRTLVMTIVLMIVQIAQLLATVSAIVPVQIKPYDPS